MARRKSRILQEKETLPLKGGRSEFFSSAFHLRIKQESCRSIPIPPREARNIQTLPWHYRGIRLELSAASQTGTIIKYSACHFNHIFTLLLCNEKLPSHFYIVASIHNLFSKLHTFFFQFCHWIL